MTALRHRRFAAIWAASIVGNIGMMMQVVGATWLMASLTPSAQMVGLVLSANALPVPVLALLAGTLADLHDRRTILIVAQVMRLLVAAALAVTTLLGLTSAWVLLTATFLLGCGTALNQPAWHASVRDQVPREDIPEAVSLNSVGFNIGRAVGPAIGGIVVTFTGAAGCFIGNAISYLALLAVLLAWRPPRRTALLPREPIGSAMRDGLRYVLLSPIKAVLVRAVVFGFCGSAIWGLVALVARDLLGAGAGTYGFLLGGFGLGAIGGAIINGRMRGRASLNGLVRTATLVFCGALAVVALSRDMGLTTIATALCGACWVTVVSTLNISVQMAAATRVVGRALALYQMAIYAGMALGGWVWGLVAERHGISIALMAAAVTLIVSFWALRGAILPEIGEELPQRQAAMMPSSSSGGSASITHGKYG